MFFAKRVHLFIGRGERGKVTLENQGTRGEGAFGDVDGGGMWNEIMEDKGASHFGASHPP